MKPVYVDTHNATVEDVREDVRAFADQMGEMAGGKLIRGVSIGTTQTAIAHGFPGIPNAAVATPHADARVWRSAAPDSRNVYLRASAACTADVYVY